MIQEQIDVLQFNRKFGFPTPDSPCVPEKAVTNLWLDLIDEEFAELKAAFEVRDIVEVADALADLKWVALGLAVVCGLKVGRGRWLPQDAEINCVPALPKTVGLSNFEKSVRQIRSYASVGRLNRVWAIVGWIFDDVDQLAWVCGIDLRSVWAEVKRSNMAKEGGGTRADGKILKPAGWQPPDIRGVLIAQGWEGGNG